MRKAQCALLLGLIIPNLFSCDVTNASTSDDDSKDIFLESVLPQTIYYNDGQYDLVTSSFSNADFVADSLVAYLINREDYERFYQDNPDVVYCIDEGNSVYSCYGDNIYSVYSLVGLSAEQYLGVAFYQSDIVDWLFLNVEYSQGD